MLLVLVPQLLYVGHWSADAGQGATGEHHQHCHSDVATCSQAPVPAGPGQILMNDDLLVLPALRSILLPAHDPDIPSSLSVSPRVPPPRATLLPA
jgi:hypothetical protein